MAILYIADWHYGHSNIIHYDNRPFLTIKEMNAALIGYWNEAVTQRDTVYILGDMFWCSDSEAINVLRSLPGDKILIRGNHDSCKNAEFRKQFVDIHDYLEIEDGCDHVVLCHYPMPCFKNHFHGWKHLYGHVHSSFEAYMMEHDKLLMEELYTYPCKMINVGAMMPWMGYTPRTLAEIESRYNQCKIEKGEDQNAE